MPSAIPTPSTGARTRLLDAALRVIRSQGYAASTVEDVCSAAGVTKGSFFHHFKGKEEMVLAAVAHWNAGTGGLFEQAPFRQLADPRDRVLGYIDFRESLLRGGAADFSCLLGTLVQEIFDSHPKIREACDDGITGHARTVARDIAEAKALYAAEAGWDPLVLAMFTQATLQGAFILAKARGDASIVAACIGHLRQHVAALLGAAPTAAAARPRPRARSAAAKPTPPTLPKT